MPPPGSPPTYNHADNRSNAQRFARDPRNAQPEPSLAPPTTGAYHSEADYEAALSAAERAGMIAIRVLNVPYNEWAEMLDQLRMIGDCEGNIWEMDGELNDNLRVVSPSRNLLTCWFSLFLSPQVYSTLNFIDGVYDFARSDLFAPNTLAYEDRIFSRRGIDHGAIVELATDKTHHPMGYHSIEDTSQVEMWRLTHRISVEAERILNVQHGTRIAIRTRYRPLLKLLLVAQLCHP